MPRFIITGCAGFIGSTCMKKLYDNGYIVIGLDNMSYGYNDNIEWLKSADPNRVLFYNIDICNKEIFNIIEKDDIVIHFAAIAPLPVNQTNPYESISNNVGGTANVLEACRINGARHFILASTSAVYENNENYPSKEDSVLNPNLIYSLGKKFSEELCKSYNTNYGLHYTIFRFFNVYGPHHDCLRKNPPLIAYLVKELLQNNQPLLHSDGTQSRDYIYVDDLIELLFLVFNNLDIANNKIYNISSEESISVKDIVLYVQNMLKTDIEPIYRDPIKLWENNTELWDGIYPIKTEVVVREITKFSLGDSSLAFKDFGWKAKTPFRVGIFNTINDTVQTLTNNS